MSSCDWPYLIAPAFWCVDVPVAQLRERLHRRARRRAICEPRVEVALHAVLEDDRAVASLPLASPAPPQMSQSRKLRRSVLRRRRSGCRRDRRSTAPCCSQDRDRLGHASSPASGFSPPRGSFAPGGVDLVVVERARDADARALERVARRGTSCSRGRAAARRRFVAASLGIGRGALERAEQDRGVRDRCAPSGRACPGRP